MVLHQKWHLRRSNIDTKLTKKWLTKTFGIDIKNNDQKTSDSVPNFLPFWSQDRSKFAPKSIRKLIQILLASWHRFLIDLGRFWDPRWGARGVQRTTVFDQKSDQIPPGRPRTPQDPPRPLQDRFWTDFEPILDRFGTDFGPILDRFGLILDDSGPILAPKRNWP